MTQAQDQLSTLITRFNNYAGFGNPAQAIYPSRTGLYYVDQAYDEIFLWYKYLLSAAQVQGLNYKLWTYEQAVRDVEAGKTVSFPFASADEGTGNPITDELTEPVNIGGLEIPKWILYLGGGAAVAAILKYIKVLK